MKKAIELKKVNKHFGENHILKDIDLVIGEGEFVTLLGPSGCGKTTTLRIIGGFEDPDDGDVIFQGKSILSLEPYERNINTVFQRYALFPRMSVFDNVAFGLRIKKKPKEEIQKKVKEMLRLVGLEGYEKRNVTRLSGGQQQRVAIARALINEPEVLLLDEPLGALDLKLRKEMQIELKKIQQEVGITFIYVTHDQEEALSMSDTIVVMNEGIIQQIGSPTDIYNEPENAFVADFIGESNILVGTMIQDYEVEFLNKRFVCVDHGFGENVEVEVVIRPEDIELVSPREDLLEGIVESVVFKGVHYDITLDVQGREILVQSIYSKEVGSKVGLVIIPEHLHIMKRGDDEI